ncbi:MAG: UDP-N-acetylmuramoyl-L-alanyl-D-glutamate--2,6-diaminopimelate ligase [Clostridia bacterium]
MLLRQIIDGLEIKTVNGNLDIDISDIAYDSRKVKKNALFVCIDGTTVDGHQYVMQAYENGAVAFLTSHEVGIPAGCTEVLVENTRTGLAFVADKFFSHPTGRFPVVGVTGTKGKTTTTYMMKQILEVEGKKVGLIGTIANMIGQQILYTERTTPEAYDLQALFCEMLEKHTDVAVMEVSSQGLMLDRVACCSFEIGVFTNIESDHIGPNEHTDFEDYLMQKLKFPPMCKQFLINADMHDVQRVKAVAPTGFLTYGIENKADIFAQNIIAKPDAISFDVITPWWSDHVMLSVPGAFNVSNALAAIGVCALLGVSKESILAGLAHFKVKGRTEIVFSNKKFTVMIDYAHNAMSLESLLKAVREYAPGRIVSVFGCGGNRDRARRFEMGEVSGKYADFTIITSDNPRNEEPEAIIADIEVGMQKTDGSYIKITNRPEAMRHAIATAQQDDIIIFAGKGHETYQIFKDTTIHFDEREIVAEILAELKVKE